MSIWFFKLKKSIYGLKQASRQWYYKFHGVITSFGFVENPMNQCIYQKVSGSKTCFLVLYVDDILLATNDKGMMHGVKQLLSKNFDMKDMGEASYVIGIKIHRDRSRGILGLSQEMSCPYTRPGSEAELDLGTHTSFTIYTFSNTVEINVA